MTLSSPFDTAFLVKATGGTPVGAPRAVRVESDSRLDLEDALFVAIAVPRFDGHDFVRNALEKGAVAALVNPDHLPPESRSGGPLVCVQDPLLSLGSLAAWHRDRFNIRMVAVTGSVGKTTTKDLIAGVLSQQWKTLKSPGNLNTEIGLPLALLELRSEHQAAVVELAIVLEEEGLAGAPADAWLDPASPVDADDPRPQPRPLLRPASGHDAGPPGVQEEARRPVAEKGIEHVFLRWEFARRRFHGGSDKTCELASLLDPPRNSPMNSQDFESLQ